MDKNKIKHWYKKLIDQLEIKECPFCHKKNIGLFVVFHVADFTVNKKNQEKVRIYSKDNTYEYGVISCMSCHKKIAEWE